MFNKPSLQSLIDRIVKHNGIWFIAATVMILSGLATNAIHDFLLGKHDIPGFISIIYIGSFVLACALFVAVKNRSDRLHEKPGSRHIDLQSKEPMQKQHILLFLSEIKKNGVDDCLIPCGISLTGAFTEDLALLMRHKETTGRFWSWEMPLRGISHHAESLKSIFLICSPQSIVQADKFMALLYRYRKSGQLAATVYVAERQEDAYAISQANGPIAGSHGIDFENLEQIKKAIDAVIGHLVTAGNAASHDLIVDITGGQKVTSIVAASMTFNREIPMQYVQTGGLNKVIAYDLDFKGKDTGAIGV